MDKGFVHIIYGNGAGKTASAIGWGMSAASAGKSVILIQFLKGKQHDGSGMMKRLEPEFKIFRFEKREQSFEELEEAERVDEIQNLKNGLNFARKVLVTGECDVLILDEVLGLVECGIVTTEEINQLITAREERVDLFLTGIYEGRELWDQADLVTSIVTKSTVDKGF